jgi:hypothetical protein
MSSSAMESVELDSLSQTGCASLRSPLSPTIPGPCSEAGSLEARANAKSVISALPLPF